MPTVFVYSEQPGLGRELISLARRSGQSVCAICIDEDHANELAQWGADRIYLLRGSHPRAEGYARPIAELVEGEGASSLLIGATPCGRELAARVAAYLQCALVSDAAEVRFTGNGLETERMIYGGGVVQTELINGFGVVTLAAGRCQAELANSSNSQVIIREVVPDARIQLVETVPIVREGADLCKADRVVCAGLGVDRKEDLKILEDLAEALGAAVGCTRPVADDKRWMPSDTYIGISGAVVNPQLYIGVGVSGQVQHTVGIRDSKVIVAINNDEKAPIFKSADYSLVGDLYEVVPLLAAAVRQS